MTWVKSYCGGKPNYTIGGDMNYEEFKEFIITKSLYETLYEDSEGREILIITVFDAWQMMNAIKEKDERWVKSYCGGKPNYTKD